MPKQRVLGKDEIDPRREKESFFFDFEKACDYLKRDLEKIDKTNDSKLQLIYMFCLIDTMAQEEANYPTREPRSKEIFCNFVLKYQKQCDYLECVEPVTLYYRVEDLIEKEIPFDFVPKGGIKMVKDSLHKGKAEEILFYIEKEKGKRFAEKKAEEHKLISLLYRMRNKAVHEMSGLGVGENFPELKKYEEPYYDGTYRGYGLDGFVVRDYVEILVIPNVFIRRILEDCVNGYLTECRKAHRVPFSNNHMLRKFSLSWYDN